MWPFCVRLLSFNITFSKFIHLSFDPVPHFLELVLDIFAYVLTGVCTHFFPALSMITSLNMQGFFHGGLFKLLMVIHIIDSCAV